MVKKFFKYVEITTKITSLFAFFMTLAYLFFTKQSINWTLTILFFASMFIFDLTTTAINNYIDSKDHPEMLPIPRRAGLIAIWVMFLLSAGMGLYIAYCTDIVVLLLGGLCFLCGVCYTYGPIPISRLPLGEIFSGFFYGVLIPFILLYINMPAGTFLTLDFSLAEINLSLQVLPILTVLLLAVAPTCATANIMVANNTCDIESDILVKRFTLPYYIGKKAAVNLFAALYYLAYLVPCIMVLLGMLSPVCLLFLVTLPLVHKNIQIFRKEQKKATTFIVAIKNYILLMGSFTLALFLAGIVARF